MRRRFRLAALTATPPAALAGTLALLACGSERHDTPTEIVAASVLSAIASPSTVTCVPGETTTFGVTVTGAALGPLTVAVSPQDANVTATASGTTITVVCGASPGSSAVRYTVTSGGQTTSGTVPVTITPPRLVVTTSSSRLVCTRGGTASLTLTVNSSPATPAVLFAAQNAAITVSSTGNVATVLCGTSAGESAVNYTVTAGVERATGSVPVTVVAAVAVLEVSPPSLTLEVRAGASITASAKLAAGAPAGTSTGVTFTSSDVTVATVSPTGIVTAGAKPGTASITVASVAEPSVKQTVAVTVTPVPLKVQINALRVTDAAGRVVAVGTGPIAGPIRATLGLDPGSFVPDSVVLTLGSGREVCQYYAPLTTARAATRPATRAGGAADFAPIDCVINTAAFDTTTGAVRVRNGERALTATVYYEAPDGGPVLSQSVSPANPINVQNSSGYFVSVVNVPTAAQRANGANDRGVVGGPQGVLWQAGSLVVSVVPVFFDQVSGGGFPITVTLSDARGQVASKAVTTPSAGGPVTVTFPGAAGAYTPTPAGGTLTGYTSPGAGSASGGGTRVDVTYPGNIALTATGVRRTSGSPVVYIDNAAPEARAQTIPPSFLLGGAGTTGFLNSGFVFADSVRQSATATPFADNNGVGRVHRVFFVRSAAGATLANTVAAGRAIPSAKAVAGDPTGPFVVVASLVDDLGNTTADAGTASFVAGTSGPFTFRVDDEPPTLKIDGLTDGGYLSLPFSATVSATDNAGFGADLLLVTAQLSTGGKTYCGVTNAAGTLAGFATTPTDGDCTPVGAKSIAFPANAPTGDYSLTIQARDAAGNLSEPQTFVITVQ